jgi:membrane protease YdiL (CAAX protease family)
MILLVYATKQMEAESGGAEASMVQADIACQYALGVEPWLGEATAQTLEGIATGPVPQRLARIVVLAELWSQAGTQLSRNPSEKALALRERAKQSVLDEFSAIRAEMVEADYVPPPGEEALMDAAQQVVEAKLAQQPVPADDLNLGLVGRHLGFAGQLATAWSAADPSDLARLRQQAGTKVVVMIGFFSGVVGAAFLGLGLAVVLVLMMSAGQTKSRFSSPSGYGYLHLEAFAVWFASFLVAQILVGLLAQGLGLNEDGQSGAGLSLIVFYVPVGIALVWLMLRHPQPRQALREAGFTTRGLASDFSKAVLTHLAFLPLLGMAIAVTLGLTLLFQADAAEANPFAPPTGPSHPIQEQFDGRWSTVLMLFFLAAVTAPIVEETVFRGLFYRYLRDWTGKHSLVFSIFFATTVNAFIFASIHPQGILGIPPLMTLAAAMSVAREWSGGLIAPMTIHAVNNGALVCFMSIMFS